MSAESFARRLLDETKDAVTHQTVITFGTESHNLDYRLDTAALNRVKEEVVARIRACDFPEAEFTMIELGAAEDTLRIVREASARLHGEGATSAAHEMHIEMANVSLALAILREAAAEVFGHDAGLSAAAV